MNIEREILLYGQREYGMRIQMYLSRLVPDCLVRKILFSSQTEHIDAIQLPLCKFDSQLEGISREIQIFVALPLKNHEEAIDHLHGLGFHNLCLYTPQLDNELKKSYCKLLFQELNADFPLVEDYRSSASVEIYMAKSIYDKPIPDYPKHLPPVIIPIQAGAALTSKRIADVVDSSGDNISKRNRRYSEMTAFYWMWKHSRADYIGLCHYRRLWNHLDDIVRVLLFADVEAVLPLPTICEHSVFEDYLLKHIPTVWKPMMEVIKRQSPDYYEAAQEFFKGKIFYASNMCILRRDVLDDLCSWMFPIVMEIEEMVGDIADRYYNRYAGFCTERLITLYFLYNKRHWKIAHAEKIFLG